MPEETNTANNALRGVANRLSLAFRSDSQLLFLGDLEENEINHVVSYLRNENRLIFSALLTPHHGTHWGQKMLDLIPEVTVSSVGKRLVSHLNENYKHIRTRNHLITYLGGDILLPVDSFGPFDRIPWWYF